MADPLLRDCADAYGVPLGGVLAGPKLSELPREAGLDWSDLPDAPVSLGQAEAWRARSWDTVRWTTDPDTAVLALWARVRLARAEDPLTACVPARAEVYALGAVVAVSGLLTALPVPIRW